MWCIDKLCTIRHRSGKLLYVFFIIKLDTDNEVESETEENDF